MKIMTILGTRPEIIRLSRIMPKLDKLLGDNHIVVWTGQNYDPKLSDIFWEELRLRKPNYSIKSKSATFGKQFGKMISGLEDILLDEKPDKVLILGDTNSSLCAILVERMGIPVYHMEAGNRCYDNTPEEINRRIIDHTSTINLPYTHRSKRNLLMEGLSHQRIHVTGNPIGEVLNHYAPQINDSMILGGLDLTIGNYVLVTLHRSENVDNPDRLQDIVGALDTIACNTKVIVSTHPHTYDKLKDLWLLKEHALHDNLKFLEPFGFFDFVRLERNANMVLTDSGTVEEEACILGVPCVVMRRTTERSETLDCGASILAGIESHDIYDCYEYALHLSGIWSIPTDYEITDVSDRVVKFLLGKINSVLGAHNE